MVEGSQIRFQLNEVEYKEFLYWYSDVFVKGKKAFLVKMDFSNLKEEIRLTLEEDRLKISSGLTDLMLLYSALSGLYMTKHLCIFYDLKDFWAVPARVFSCENQAEQWKLELMERIAAAKNQRYTFREVKDKYAQEGSEIFSFIRTVDETSESYLPFAHSKAEMKQRRRLNVFPYRHIGDQMVIFRNNDLLECSERAIVTHRYQDITQVINTDRFVYLIKSNGEGVMLPLLVVGGVAGIDKLIHLCQSGCETGGHEIRSKKISIPFYRRWDLPNLQVLAVCLLVLGTAAGILGISNWLPDQKSVSQSSRSEVSFADTGGDSGYHTVTVPDHTVFDVMQEDHTFVSSNLYYRIRIPVEQWEISQDPYNQDDVLSCSWGNIQISKSEMPKLYVDSIRHLTPKTKEAYQVTVGSTGDNEVISYSLTEDVNYQLTKSEVRSTGGSNSYIVGMTLLGNEVNYHISVNIKEESAERIQMARQILDSFQTVDTSVGYLKEKTEQDFDGYYGRNLYMTSCLVLMDHQMSEEEIKQGLEQLKKIKGNWMEINADTIAIRSPESRWLGIDSPNLQQNCSKQTVKAVSQIFDATVMIYDEFDGDLLMVAYSDADQKPAYARATSFNKSMLETEFQCYGKDQRFPEDLLPYMDLTKEEAEAIWTDEKTVFQMDKWYKLTAHMTKMPIPIEFVGVNEFDRLDNRFEIIR